MHLHEVASGNRPWILRGDDGSLSVDGVRHRGAVLVLGSGVLDWRPRNPAEIDADSLRPVLQAAPAPDLLLLGLGPSHARLPAAAAAALDDAGIARESMTTASAARAYNALAGDPREVAFAAICG